VTLRILEVVPTLGIGGAERMMSSLARHLRAWEHEVGVLSLYAPLGTVLEQELRSSGVELFFLGKRRGLDLRMLPRVARAVAAYAPAVVHTHHGVLKYVAPAVLAARRCPIVHTMHSVAHMEAERPARVLQFFAFRCGVVPVAIGETVARTMERSYRLRPRHLIANGIRTGELGPPPGAREELRASLGIAPGAPTFVIVAGLHPHKNHAAAIRALASRRLRAAGAHLVLAGDGVTRAALERQSRDLGVASAVHFLGIRPDVPRVLAAGDAFVLPSTFEGNPLSVMEAMAAGKPVVATAVGCIPELVSPETGLVVPPGDDAALEAALFTLAHDLARARALGAAGRRVARDRFDDERTARAYERLFTELAAGGVKAHAAEATP
jgi:glycosyltransferase involved in cell wall biosynthesis